MSSPAHDSELSPKSPKAVPIDNEAKPESKGHSEKPESEKPEEPAANGVNKNDKPATDEDEPDYKESLVTKDKPRKDANETNKSAIEEQETVPKKDSDNRDPKESKKPYSDNEIADTTMADVSMTDAPALNKVSRERDDDNENEPLAKRTKLDSTEDNTATTPAAPIASAPTTATTAENTATANGTCLNGLDSLPHWNDEELAKQEITPFQAREYRRVIAGIKKTKGGAHFKDSVIRLWPTLTEAYLERVATPMDLGTLERTLRDEPYSTMGEFKEAVALIYLNTKAFNGELHDITLAGLGVVDAVWRRCLAISSSEPSRPKLPVKQQPSRHHEQRQSTTQPSTAASQSSPAPAGNKTKSSTPAARHGASPATNKSSASDVYVVPANGGASGRKASTLTESDRPKRTIHPPKSKDIDYGKGGKKKSVKPELEFCEEVLAEIRHSRHYDINAAFLDPVDPVALDIPNYFQVIKKPMDLSTIGNKLQNGDYSNTKQFLGDVDLMFRNCYTFNSPGTPVNMQGKALEKLFREQWAKKDEWLARHAASKASAAAVNVSDDEMYDDEAPRARDSNLDVEIQAYEEKLKQETQKLLDLYLENSPNKAMIDLQKTMLNVIQETVLESKRKRGDVKPDSRSKSKSKAARAPKSSGTPAKKSGAGRKSMGGTNAPKKRQRTFPESDKALIASAINELSGAAIENAIDIIKRDTNQTENNNGELELDIDQLSNEALQKLWDLCKRNLLGFGHPETHEASPDETPVQNYGNGAAAKQPKPKKNKPMSAREQEARIAHLTQVREQFRGGNPTGASPEPVSEGAMDSEDESDSEEE